jgi:uncharacterized membrane protein
MPPKEHKRAATSPLALLERDTRQLGRLNTLMDVIYALLVWAAIRALPKPTPEEWGSGLQLLEVLKNHAANYQITLVSIMIVLTYWIQSNALLGNLIRTDKKHAVISILQIFFLLIYTYFSILGVVFDDTASLVLQSAFLTLAGLAAIYAWSYAMKGRRLLSEALSDEEARDLRIENLAEPLAALCTIPFAWVSTTAWSLSLVIGTFLFGWLLKKHSKPAKARAVISV